MTRDLIKIGTGETKDTVLLQAEDTTKYKIIIDDASSTVSYYGWAQIGSATSSAVWRIMKKTISSTITTYTWADGNTSFDNIWDNRASLSYS